MKQKLSPKLVEHLKAPGPKRMDVWDSILQCFGVSVSPGGRKSWIVIARVDGRQKRVTIGTYPAVSLAAACTTSGQKTQLEPYSAVPRGSSRATSKLTTRIMLSRERLVDQCRFPDKSFCSKGFVSSDNGGLPSRSRRNPYHQH